LQPGKDEKSFKYRGYGQDGTYPAEFLLEKGYEVYGIKRRTSLFNTDRIDHLHQDPHPKGRRFILHHGDMTHRSRLIRIIQQMLPDEIYNLAARSHVAVSFEEPEDTTISFLRVEGTPEPETAARHFRHRVLRMLAEKGAIEESVLRNLLA